ncbi:MAG: hypothetical protein MH204_00350, partial [Fimbriimonadaceae bacterium]|nr:hypothetical protein [Fimbriimonadaceae bacterium]
LFDTFKWAVESSLAMISGPHHAESRAKAEELLTAACEAARLDGSMNLAEWYEALLPIFHRHVAGPEVEVETTATTRLLAFHPESARLPRFRLLDHFLNPRTRAVAEEAYNESVRGSEIYTLDRFGVGALPFDVLIPGVGRGTLRLGTRGGVIMTPEPQGFRFKKAPESAEELAAILERRFGKGVVLIGKALTLLGMLAAEHVFVFHEGASGYAWRSRQMHRRMAVQGLDLRLHPILRIRHRTWTALADCCAWIALPEPFRRPFGTGELSAPSFARRRVEVAETESELIADLSRVNRPKDLVALLQSRLGGHWSCLSSEYDNLQIRFDTMNLQLDVIRREKRRVLERIRERRAEVDRLHHELGRQWRAEIFEVEKPSAEALARREEIKQAIHEARVEIDVAWDQWRGLQAEQDGLVGGEDIREARRRRRAIALEAELTRARLVREAIISSQGLDLAERRPSAWWFPMICPAGTWFEAAFRRAEFRLEPLL